MATVGTSAAKVIWAVVENLNQAVIRRKSGGKALAPTGPTAGGQEAV